MEIVRLLLDSGAKVDLHSALMYAMEHEQYKMVEVFMECCAHNDLLGDNGCSPLMFACMHGLYEMAKLVVEKGGLVDLKDNNG